MGLRIIRRMSESEKQVPFRFRIPFSRRSPGDGPAAVARGTQLIHLAFHLRFLFDDFETFIWQFPVAVSVGSEHQGIPRLLAVLMGIVYFAA